MPDRAAPIATDDHVTCAHADRCSGCPLIDRPYAAQLEIKRERLARAVARYPSLSGSAIETPRPAEPRTGYRIRAKLVVAPGPRIGLFAKGGGHVVVDIPECRVLAPALVETVAAVRTLLTSAPPSAGGALIARGPDGDGALCAVDVREIDDGAQSGVLVTLVIDTQRKPSGDQLSAAAAAIRAAARRVLGVALSLHREDSPQVLGTAPSVIDGPASAHDRLGPGPLYHVATYGSFAQAHRTEAAAIREALTREIAGGAGSLAGRRILDLFGGSGATSLILARAGATATLVDSFAPAAESARLAAHAQQLPDIDVRVGDATRITEEMAARGERFDAVIANPPRRGIAPTSRQAIADLGPAAIAYVSCDPETLARDLDHFVRLGYRTDRLFPFDLMPQTDHVETLAVLRPGSRTATRIAYQDDAVLIVEKASHEAISGPGRLTLLERARAVAGDDVVPVSSLPYGASGLVVLAKGPALAPAVRAALSAPGARGICLLGVRGITARTGAIPSPKAKSRYRRIGVAAGHSVVSVASRDLRFSDLAHGFARIGHHVLGEGRFGHLPTNVHFEQKYGLCRPFFHCTRIEFPHPFAQAPVAAESPLSGDLAAVLGRMGADPASFCRAPGTSNLGHAHHAE